MKRRVHWVLRALASAGALLTSCAEQDETPPTYRWSNVTVWDDSGVCIGGAPPTPFTVCDWATSFDDLIVFALDEADLVESPVFRDGVAVDETECTSIAPGAMLHGSTQSSAFGAEPRSIFVIYPNVQADYLETGTKSLWRVAHKDQTVFAIGEPVPVTDGRLDITYDETCGDDDQVNGKAVDLIIEEVSHCEAGSRVDTTDAKIGGLCFVSTPINECNIDSDCTGPGVTCVDGNCV